MAIAHEAEHIQRCKAIFISWTWATILMGSLLAGGISIAWAGSRQLSQIESRSIENAHKIIRIQEVLDKELTEMTRILNEINRKLD